MTLLAERDRIRPLAGPVPRSGRHWSLNPWSLNPADGGALLLGFGASALLIAAVFGVETAFVVLGTVVGGTLLVAAVVRPAIALLLLIVMEFANVGEVLAVGGLFGGMLGLGLLSILVALRHGDVRERMRTPPWTPLLLMGCYLVTLAPSIRYTLAPDPTDQWLEYMVKDCVLLLIVLVLAHIVNRPWWIAAAIVATLSLVAGMTVVNQVFLGALPSTFGGFATVSEALGEQITTPRHAGPTTDANFWGRHLLLALPLAYALTHRSGAAGRSLPQWGWSASAAMLLGAIYLTQSRGALLSTLVATVVWVVAGGPRVRRGALLVAPLIALVLFTPGVGNRLLNLSAAFEDVPAYAIDPSLVQRSAAQEIAAIIFADNPLFGTGPGSFGSVIYEYSSQSGDLLVGPTTAQHNTYLEIASESGLVGLVGWVVLLGGIAVLACRSVLRLAGAPQDGRIGAPTRALAAGVLASVAGWATGSVFLHVEYFRPVLILFVLVGVLANRVPAPHPDRDPQQVAAAQRATRGLVEGAAVAAVTALAVGILSAAMLVNLSEPRYKATALFTLLPSSGTYAAYAIDVRNRVPVLPAYAAMIQSDHEVSEVRVDAEPQQGIITMTVVGPDRPDVEERVALATARAPEALARFRGDLQYRLVSLTQPELTVEPSYPAEALTTTGLAVLAELLLIAGAVGHIRRRRRVRTASRSMRSSPDPITVPAR